MPHSIVIAAIQWRGKVEKKTSRRLMQFASSSSSSPNSVEDSQLSFFSSYRDKVLLLPGRCESLRVQSSFFAHLQLVRVAIVASSSPSKSPRYWKSLTSNAGRPPFVGYVSFRLSASLLFSFFPFSFFLSVSWLVCLAFRPWLRIDYRSVC
jgi:hypothetical protein